MWIISTPSVCRRVGVGGLGEREGGRSDGLIKPARAGRSQYAWNVDERLRRGKLFLGSQGQLETGAHTVHFQWQTALYTKKPESVPSVTSNNLEVYVLIIRTRCTLYHIGRQRVY